MRNGTFASELWHLHKKAKIEKKKNEENIFEQKNVDLKQLNHLNPCTVIGSQIYRFLGKIKKINILGDINDCRQIFLFVLLFRCCFLTFLTFFIKHFSSCFRNLHRLSNDNSCVGFNKNLKKMVQFNFF